jgi:hypothetical protein
MPAGFLFSRWRHRAAMVRLLAPAGASTNCVTSIELLTPNVLVLISAMVQAVMLMTSGVSRDYGGHQAAGG